MLTSPCFVAIITSIGIAIASTFLIEQYFQANSQIDDQYYHGHHWTTSEINAKAIQHLEDARQQKEISMIKYLFIKYFVLKLYIPKDKSKWGK